jgi:hypothetical protein
MVEILQAQTTGLQDDNARVVPAQKGRAGLVPEQKLGNSLVVPEWRPKRTRHRNASVR